MRNKIKIKFKILIAILLSFLFSSLLNREIFLANTPRLKMPLHEYIITKIKWGLYMAKYGNKALELKNKPFTPAPSTLKNMQEVIYAPVKKISQGIYAQQKGNVVRFIIKENEIEWVEYRFRIRGKERIIKIPKDQAPPTREKLEEIFRNTY